LTWNHEETSVKSTKTRRTPILAVTAGLATVTAAIFGVLSAGPRTGGFRLAADDTQTCRVHQSALPSAAYTGGVKGDTQAIMLMMHDYTAHGTQPYCDGRKATSEDQAWTRLYAELGGSAEVKQ